MFDESASGALVQCHGALFGLGLEVLDLSKVSLHASEFREHLVLLGIHATKSQVRYSVSQVLEL